LRALSENKSPAAPHLTTLKMKIQTRKELEREKHENKVCRLWWVRVAQALLENKIRLISEILELRKQRNALVLEIEERKRELQLLRPPAHASPAAPVVSAAVSVLPSKPAVQGEEDYAEPFEENSQESIKEVLQKDTVAPPVTPRKSPLPVSPPR